MSRRRNEIGLIQVIRLHFVVSTLSTLTDFHKAIDAFGLLYHQADIQIRIRFLFHDTLFILRVHDNPRL